jgi:rubrerythrin
MAHVRYLLYAQKAREEGFPGIAHLFRALALSRYTRASDQYRLVSELIGTRTASVETYFTLARTMDNTERARDAEAMDANEVISAYVAVAESQHEMAAVKNLKRSAAICHRRAAILDSVFLQTRRADEEPCISDIFLCKNCGNILEAPLPGTCTICDAGSESFMLVE